MKTSVTILFPESPEIERCARRHPSARVWPIGRVLPLEHDTSAVDAGIISPQGHLTGPVTADVITDIHNRPPMERVRTGEGQFVVGRLFDIDQ